MNKKELQIMKMHTLRMEMKREIVTFHLFGRGTIWIKKPVDPKDVRKYRCLVDWYGMKFNNLVFWKRNGKNVEQTFFDLDDEDYVEIQNNCQLVVMDGIANIGVVETCKFKDLREKLMEERDNKKEGEIRPNKTVVKFHVFPTRTKTSKDKDYKPHEVIKSNICTDPEDKVIWKGVVQPPMKNMDDPLHLGNSCYLFDLGIRSDSPEHSSVVVFDITDPDLPRLRDPTDIILAQGLKEVGIVYEDRFKELRQKLLTGKKRKRVNQEDGDRVVGPSKKHRVDK